MKIVRPPMRAAARKLKLVGPSLPKKAPAPAAPKAPKVGDGRNPHDGKALDQQGDVSAWEHGHYDYPNKGKGGT